MRKILSVILLICLFFLVIPAKKASATTLVNDTFTGTNGTALTAHTPDTDTEGGGWFNIALRSFDTAGGVTIQSNQASMGTQLGGVAINAGSADVIITADWTLANPIPANHRASLVFRHSSNGNHFIMFARTDLDDVQLIRVEANNITNILDTGVYDFANGQTYELKVETNGQNIIGYINDTEVINTTSSFNEDVTNHGFLRQATTTIAFDNFNITDNTRSIAITSPTSYQIFQRNGSDQANISISGTYEGTPTAIETSWDGGAYSTIDASPAGGTFSGTLSNQPVGQGTLTVRFTNDTSVTNSSTNVSIGDVYIVAGQSNAQGRITNAQSYSHATYQASMFQEGGSAWLELQDPTDGDVASSDYNSVWPLLATLIMADQDVPVGFITAADGGTTLVEGTPDWRKGDVSYEDLITTVSNSNVNDAKAILWLQGESEILATPVQSEYQTALSLMLDNMQTDLGFASIPLIAGNMGEITASDSNINAIRLAIINRWENDSDIYPGPVGHDQDFTDNLHWKTDVQAQTLANRWFRSIDPVIYSGVEAARGPQVSSITYEGNEITITFTGGQGDLVNGTDNTGFSVTDGNGARTISSSSSSGKVLTLTMDQELVDTVEVSFANGNDAVGATLVDSHTYPQPPEPFIEFSATESDSTPPVISLDTLTGGETNDTTPLFTGSATDATGTVSLVEYQIDSTSGSWISCTSDDGTFDEAAEDFTCSVSSELAAGSHTIYVRATDDSANVTSSGSYTSQVFTVVILETGSISGHGIIYGCKDRNAVNYNRFSSHDPSLCRYETDNFVVTGDFAKPLEEISCVPIANLMKLGSRQGEVSKLQQTLNSLGFNVGPVDGWFGNLTNSGVKAFQASQNIDDDGIVGPITRSKLNQYCK